MRVSSHAKTKQKGQASEDSLPVLVSPKEIKILLSVCPLYKNLALTIPPHWKLSGIASQGLSVVCLNGQQALWIETLVGEVIAILRNGYYFFLNKMKLIVNYEKKSKKAIPNAFLLLGGVVNCPHMMEDISMSWSKLIPCLFRSLFRNSSTMHKGIATLLSRMKGKRLDLCIPFFPQKQKIVIKSKFVFIYRDYLKE